MAWNGSDGKSKKREDIRKECGGRFSVSFAFLILLVLIIVGSFAWWRSARVGAVTDSPRNKLISNHAPITEVKPATVVVVETNAPEMIVSRERLPPGTKRTVVWKRPDNWDQLTRAQKTRVQPVARVIKPIGWDDRRLFSQSSDRRIERLMRVKPGQLILGTLTYNEKFVSDFLESLKTPIVFDEEDTEDDRAIKQAVIDARSDLKAAYDRGEDIVEIMNKTEKELHELATYRIDLRRLISEYRKSGEHSENDVKDYINAANIILRDNGMEPLRLGELWFRKSQYDASASNDEQTEKEGK